jgi:hypothetical protein
MGFVLAVPASAATPSPLRELQGREQGLPHGIAKNFKVIKTADGLTGRPFVSFKLYVANHTRDRDKDGVACET